MNSSRYLEMADRLGARICRDAIWDSARCNWVAGYGHEELVYRALDPSVYTGTSGIALFLGRLSRATGDKIFRDTANGALRQALSQLDRMNSAGNHGLYSGRSGMCCVAAEFGEHARAPFLLPAGIQEFDLIEGAAGILVAALHLHHLNAAVQLGDTLLEAARKTDRGWSWPTMVEDAPPGRPHLTGFAHGAAGIAASLLELWNVTHEAKYRAAAEEGFRYEQSCFSAEHRGWPDFRNTGDENSEADYPAFWCHGAGGIALSRLRAAQLTGDPRYVEQARVGLAAVAESMQDREGSCGICHGLFGAIDMLLIANTPESLVLAHGAASEAIDRYPIQRLPWPCEPGSHETPDLMLGLAGIGHTFLRLADPAAFPSPLML